MKLNEVVKREEKTEKVDKKREYFYNKEWFVTARIKLEKAIGHELGIQATIKLMASIITKHFE